MFVKDHFDKAFSCNCEPLEANLERAEFIVGNVPEGVRTVLDVGCGTGLLRELLRKNGIMNSGRKE